MKAPSSHELGIRKGKRMKLHCKEVGTILYDKLIALHSADPARREEVKMLRRWLKDPASYEKVPLPAKVRTTRLPKEFMKDIEEKGKAEKAPAGTSARSTVKVFTVEEFFKSRERLIEHPDAINEATKDDVWPTKFLAQAERHNALLLGTETVTVDVDASAWFDQFGIDEEVRDFFTFMFEGELWRLRVLPMGLRHSVAVAHAATRQLLNFELDGVWAEPYIDNIRFVGPPEKVRKALRTFLLRCREVGVTLNEVDVTSPADIDAKVESLPSKTGTWLGEEYDYINGTVHTTAKTREKIRLAAKVEHPTWRNVASRVALLRYASTTSGLRLSPYFGALRAYSAAARMLGSRPDLWDAPALEPQPHVLESIAKWERDVLEAPPRKITVPQEPTAVLITDASDWGFGGIFINCAGDVFHHAQTWSTADRETGFTKTSNFAEPEGILRLIRRFVKPSDRFKLKVRTDNDASVGAYAKGHSPSFFINQVCNRVQAEFPLLELDLEHLAGAKNPSDGISRGKELSADDWAKAVAIARDCLGD